MPGHMSMRIISRASSRLSRDYRIPTLIVLMLVLLLLGYGFSRLSGRGVEAETPSTRGSAMPADHPKMGFSNLPESSADALREQAEELPLNLSTADKSVSASEARKILQQAGAEIKAKRYNRAIATLNAAQPQIKDIPETYLLIGRALEGKKDYATARDFYRAAIDRDPYLADAYWGYATASEGLNDLESALGAMRSYLHTDSNPDPRRLRMAQARSAIWEWESQLGRGAWGPTKGVPPGFTAEELKRDGRGVGIKMPVAGTDQPEIKSQDKFKLFKED